MTRSVGIFIVGLAVGAGVMMAGGPAARWPVAGAQPAVTQQVLLENERVTVMEVTFPAGFVGEEHAATADEFAYVLAGQFSVVTSGQGKRVVREGEVEYAAKGTLHYSLNESDRPARVLVGLLKER
jgi:quercetin dioxygenase-like cupin family protein